MGVRVVAFLRFLSSPIGLSRQLSPSPSPSPSPAVNPPGGCNGGRPTKDDRRGGDPPPLSASANVLDDGPQGKVRGNVSRRNTTKRFLMLGRDLSTKKTKIFSKCEKFQLFGNL